MLCMRSDKEIFKKNFHAYEPCLSLVGSPGGPTSDGVSQKTLGPEPLCDKVHVGTFDVYSFLYIIILYIEIIYFHTFPNTSSSSKLLPVAVLLLDKEGCVLHSLVLGLEIVSLFGEALEEYN